jgi:tetratricopeptide (TPR) repeat protein
VSQTTFPERIVNFWRKLPVWQGGLILLLVFLAYLPALEGGFVWDDNSWTINLSALFHDASGLWLIWFQPTTLQQYYPLTGTTFWLDYQLWEFWTLPYHVENVLLHALAALLFWRLLLRLQVPGAWLAGALFALHPVMVESVAWITERKNVLSLTLYLGAWLAYLRYAQGVASDECRVTRTEPVAAIPDSSPGTRHSPLFYGLAFVLFLGALLAKTTACSLPAAILLIGWWKRGQIRWRADVLPTLPFFALALGLCTVTAWLEKYHVGAQGSDFALTFSQRCLVAGRAFWFYLGHLFWPANLCFVYPRWQPDPGAGWQWLYPGTAIGTMLTLWLARERIGRGPVTALLFFVGTLFPVLGFINAYGMRYSFVWDHWVYLPALGIIAFVAGLVMRKAESRRAPAMVCGFAAIMLPVLALLTWRQAGMYVNMETLWRTTLSRNPDCWMAHNNLGSHLYHKGHLEQAMEHYQMAIQLNPNDAEVLSNLGGALDAQGRLEEAIETLRQAIQIDPNHFDAQYNLGIALADKGRFDEAIANYYRAIQIKPGSASVRNNLGVALFNMGQFDEAIETYRRAIRIKPDYCEALDNLGIALATQGRFDEAIETYRRAIQVNSNRPETILHLGMTLGRLGRTREAVVQYREALRLNPNLAGALTLLAWTLAASPDVELRNGAEAVRLAERACELTHYGEPLSLGTLATAYAESGRFPEAVTMAKKAEQLAASAGRTDVAAKNRQLLELYRAGKPYHEPAPTEQSDVSH